MHGKSIAHLHHKGNVRSKWERATTILRHAMKQIELIYNRNTDE